MTLFVALSIKFYPAAWRGGDADNAATHWHEMSQLNIHIRLFCDEAQRNIAGVLSPVHCALLRSPGQITAPLTDVSIHITTLLVAPNLYTENLKKSKNNRNSFLN